MSENDEYTKEEVAERMERGLKRALNMPHKPQANPKKQRPARKGRMRKGKSRR
ncbi:MAG TPA: hypothetical protein VMA53_17450 [Stellaceae bacterium]|nr:hypothetical protein [Stellaceae bacterium]